MLNKLQYFLKREYKLVITVLFLLILCVFVYYKVSMIKERGVYVIVHVDSFKGDADGSSFYLTVIYKGKSYKNVIDYMCKECIGKYFFAKIEKDKPEGYLIFYEDKPVLDSILNGNIPYEGWQKIPL